MKQKEYAERPNKTAIKREIAEVRSLVEALVDLSDERLRKLELGDSLTAAIVDTRRLKKSALQRQLRYLTAQLRQKDTETIRATLDRIHFDDRRHIEAQHQAETWRESLLEDEGESLGKIIARFPSIDVQHLRQLLRKALSDTDSPTSKNAYRQVFRLLLRHLQEEIDLAD